MDSRIKRLFKDPYYAARVVFHRLSPIIKSDELAVRVGYFLSMHKKLNLEHPKTYNEKLQWLKLHDKREVYTKMVDKLLAKDYVHEVLGDGYTFKTLGVWKHFDDIDFDKLPNQFVLKCTHDSGGLIICKDKSKLNIERARKKINKCLKKNYYYATREYPYRNVVPRIIAEEYMVDESGTELKDYKFFCFDGVPQMLFVATDRAIDTRFDFYDSDFNHLPFTQGHPWADKEIKKPVNFDEMLDLAARLSVGIPHVRVDLYNIHGKVYFGEMTFFHYSGTMPIYPEEWDYKIGEWLELPSAKEN